MIGKARPRILDTLTFLYPLAKWKNIIAKRYAPPAPPRSQFSFEPICDDTNGIINKEAENK